MKALVESMQHHHNLISRYSGALEDSVLERVLMINFPWHVGSLQDSISVGSEGCGLEGPLASLADANANFKSASKHVKMHLAQKKEPKAKAKGRAAKAKAAAAV